MLSSGATVGPFVIGELLGSGGMGRVYRAHDHRLGRDVAIKVLPPAYARDVDWQRRFEREARAAGSINHPNVVAVYDVGIHEGSPYVVSELLDGQTLRQRLAAGPLPWRRVVELGRQLVHGLAAAHERGVVHRDLKPENVFVTRDGRLKIFDFGLAKEIVLGTEETTPGPQGGPIEDQAMTQPGALLGTAAYMSPEQVRAQPVDTRSDVFAVGAILYELLTGRRAFQRDTAVETMHAILKEEPVAIEELVAEVPAPLALLITRCLQKSAHQRFQATSDLAFALDTLAMPAGSSSSPAGSRPAPPEPVRATPEATSSPAAAEASTELTPPARGRRRWRVGALIAVAAALPLAGYLVGARGSAGSEPVGGEAQPPSRPAARAPADAVAASPRFRRITFRPIRVPSARLASAGGTIYYTAAPTDAAERFRVFAVEPGNPESRPVPITESAQLAAVSAKGELAVLVRPYHLIDFGFGGTLARVPQAGGAPRELAHDARAADWAADGSLLAVIESGGKTRLQWPTGQTLFESDGWIGQPRIAPDGKRVAFIDHPTHGDMGGSIAVVEPGGKPRALAGPLAEVDGLAWAGDEIWFATVDDDGASLRAVDQQGNQRTLVTFPGRMHLFDATADGTALVSRRSFRSAAYLIAPELARERDLSWFDWSIPKDLDDRGELLLLLESGEAGGSEYRAYLRPTDGTDAVLLGRGIPHALSPDGKHVLMGRPDRREVLEIVPTGAGEARTLPAGALAQRGAGQWFPDGERVVFHGAEAAGTTRVWVQEVRGGAPRAISPEGFRLNFGRVVSPDGRQVVAVDAQGRWFLLAVDPASDGSLPAGKLLPIDAHEAVARWTADGKLVVYDTKGRCRIEILDPASGRRRLVRELTPPAGVDGVTFLFASADLRIIAYTAITWTDEVYLLDRLR